MVVFIWLCAIIFVCGFCVVTFACCCMGILYITFWKKYKKTELVVKTDMQATGVVFTDINKMMNS